MATRKMSISDPPHTKFRLSPWRCALLIENEEAYYLAFLEINTMFKKTRQYLTNRENVIKTILNRYRSQYLSLAHKT